MSQHLDHWVELSQSGRLLDRSALETLSEAPAAAPWLVDRLRDALLATTTGQALKGAELSTLIEFVLEEICGLRDGWRKGRTLTPSDSEKLLDGTELRPQRLLASEKCTSLAVFTTTAERVGLHKGRRALAHVVEYLRRRGIPLGLLTNGREWRLVFADSDNFAWVEWTADRWLEADAIAPTLELFRQVLSAPSLALDSGGGFKLLAAIRQTRKGEAKLSKELGERVRNAVELLLRARRTVLEPSWDEAAAKAVYDAACHFVMRLVVILFAEARELLPVDSPIYYRGYGLRGLLDALERAGRERRQAAHSAWSRLVALFRLLHTGSSHPQLLVTAYGGELFRAGDSEGDPIQRKLGLLESTAAPPDDETLYRILVLLTRTLERVRDGATFRTVATPVDFTELTSEYIGILYEGLLDYELHRAGSEPIVFLALGDQPALPLDRLEAMSDKQLAGLVDKMKVRPKEADGEDESNGDSAEETSDESANEDAGTEVAVEDVIENSPAEEEHAGAMNRALAWAARAAVASKLVKPRRGQSRRGGQQAEIERAARQLITSVKLPGEFYLVRWGGTRKGTGTFYTRPQLTLPIVRRTLAPLLLESSGKSRAPEELLSIKVCDPAMGSGSFLVASLRVLTEAVARSLHEHDRLPHNGELVRIDCELIPEADRNQRSERVEAIIRRAVVEHCLYGVDLDPLAVELARVSLWVETLDRRLPFTFLDHKLRCGDALVGTWLDHFRDYPLLAWWRQSPDERWRGVNHESDIWASVLKQRRQAVLTELVELLTGQENWLTSGVSDDELKSSIARVRELYRTLRKVPASQPDKRAEIWRKNVAPDPALARVREAFDTWCALWFWPLDELEHAPSPAALARPSEAARQIVRTVREQRRFFHWELEFPDVFTERGAGFDAVVGNPPWETKKPKSQEFFSNYDTLFRGYSKQEALTRQRELFAEDPRIEEEWLKYSTRFKDEANFARHAGHPFGDQMDEEGRAQISLVSRNSKESTRLRERWKAQRARHTGYADSLHPFSFQGSADLNTYKMFAEVAYRLLKTDGSLGLVLPAALLSDYGSRNLRELLVFRSNLDLIYVFQNERKVFQDIHHASKQMILVTRRLGRDCYSTSEKLSLLCRLGINDSPEAEEIPDDLRGVKAPTLISRLTLEKLCPKSLSILELREARDLQVLQAIYDNAVLLGDTAREGWGIRYSAEFHMTSDSRLFIPREQAAEAGYRADLYGMWTGPDGDVLLPLYEGRMIGQFDFSRKGWVAGKGRNAVWRDISWDEKLIEPQYLLRRTDYFEERPESSVQSRVAFMDVTAATNSRTMISCALPAWPCGNSSPILLTSGSPLVLSAILNSFVYDFVARIRCGGLHLNYFVIDETPLVPRDKTKQIENIVAPLYWNPALAPLLIELNGYRGRAALSGHERLRLRCTLDAVIAALYGISRQDFRWILRDCDHPKDKLADKVFCRTLDTKAFWRVDKELDPELRHPVLTLVAFEHLQQLIDKKGDVSQGIAAFLGLNNGEGWMLPASLRLADYGLGHDERAAAEQPVADRMGPRFYDWQLAKSADEIRIEYEGHARAILGDAEFARRFGHGKTHPVQDAWGVPESAPLVTASSPPQLTLFAPESSATSTAERPLPMTISEIRLLNYRNWGEEHWSNGIALKPLTLVLGRNSAGKTSILQPLRMLKQTVEATDAGVHLHLGAGLADGVNLGAFGDVVNQHDTRKEIGVGIDLQNGISVDVRFREVSSRPVIESLAYRFRGEKIEVTRTHNAYQLLSPRFRLPNWDGARDVHEPKKSYEPGRAIELSEEALADLGPTLGPQVRNAILTVRDALKTFHFLGPLRPQPAREVTWSQQDPTRLGPAGTETVQALISSTTRQETSALLADVSQWLKRLDLADGIEVRRLGSSLLYQLEVIRSGDRSNLVDVGYGVSQVLPVIVLLHFVPEGSVILCEDPESHLHPVAQATLADMFVELARRRGLQVMLETHSEHLFRRLQYLIAAEKIRNDECALYYIERENPSAKLTRLESDEFGRLKNWPEHFFGDSVGETGRQLRSMAARMNAKRTGS